MKSAAIALAIPSLAFAVPAAAATPAQSVQGTSQAATYGASIPGAEIYEHGRHKRYKRGHSHRRDYRSNRRYDERVGRNTRVWQGDDGRYYCRKENGTTGLLIGGVVGGLAGREIARDRTLGAIIGAAGGALLGRAIDRSNSRCR